MMRFKVFALLLAGLVTATGCSQEGPGGSNSGAGRSGNASSTSGGGQSGGGSSGASSSEQSGGSSGSAGAQSSGGDSASGGSSSSSAGGGGQSSGGSKSSEASGGSSAPVSSAGGTTGGKSSAGGTSAGGNTASGGNTTAGGTTAKGGSTDPGSSGGSTSGGATASGGATGSGGASGTLSPADIVPDLDGFYFEGTCSGNVSVSGKNCPMYDNGATTCGTGTSFDSRGTVRNKVLTVKGDSSKTYTINFEVRGVAGTRCYTGGKAASTATPSTTGANNTWYVGGKQANDSIWNSYELRVAPAVTGEANVYFLNAFPASPDWCQKEATYQIGYTASFKVQGGGTLTFTIHDANCQAQQNCGSNEGATTCDSPRSNIDLSGMSPAATFKQPPTNTIGTKTFYPQWLYFDVKSVTSP